MLPRLSRVLLIEKTNGLNETMKKPAIIKFPKNYWSGLIFLVLVYTGIQLMISRPDLEIPGFPGLFRQVFRWFTIALVYATGGIVLKQTGVDWLKAIWHLVHLTLILYLGAVTAYEYLIAPVSYAIRASVAPIIEFLISPVLYLCAGLVYSIYVRELQP
jgi:hypothetical protein